MTTKMEKAQGHGGPPDPYDMETYINRQHNVSHNRFSDKQLSNCAY